MCRYSGRRATRTLEFRFSCCRGHFEVAWNTTFDYVSKFFAEDDGLRFPFRVREWSALTGDGNTQAAEVLTWQWRDYDPATTEQTFVQEESEKAKSCFG